jgi:hypothetical protein
MAKAEKAQEPARTPKTKSERTRAGADDAAKERTKIRERISRRMMRVPFLRRRYVKRMLKYMDKSKEKGKRLPPELWELNRFLSQVPKAQRAEKLEEAITAQRNEEPIGNRDLRRASANQSRQSGKAPGRYRPGSPPRSMQPGPRIPKKPR